MFVHRHVFPLNVLPRLRSDMFVHAKTAGQQCLSCPLQLAPIHTIAEFASQY